MKTTQETFTDSITEIVRITYVEGRGIDAERGVLDEGEFMPTHPADQFEFAEHPELEAMYTDGVWNMQIVSEFFTDAPNEDAGANDFKPLPQMPDDDESDELKWLDGYVRYYEAVTHSSGGYDDDPRRGVDEGSECVNCGKPNVYGYPADGMCGSCRTVWNS